ncbi:tetratricopeptide repeat protein [Microcoleus sp. PH2017_08_TRC_O_A]|uniref:tetratricopeptide repeat protein n=1 Tax=Microcoleus sp. PH2017_08_TRC_O_A TaxID=2798819 RepID=UPI0025DB2B9D|nr:tetratricopeptide repeat protein [Microcoleus sp. PH2017_08_TRC_O_A]
MQVKRQSNGEVIDLGSEIARGGEGAIHPYRRDPSLVMKIYHAEKLKDIDSDKLQLMLANPPDDSVKKNHGCVSIAWPVDLLLSIDGSEQIMGFLMPRVPMQQVRPIHDYYSPKTRREKNLGFNYLSLHRTARNFAGAMSALHAKQYVIGDVNESNILVYDTAIVTLVDTDSFQVRDFQQGKVYRCRVGKAEYTPPELQGKRFADYDRTSEHDLFGLGVLIFQLLMEGTHPFAGVYQGTGDPPPTEKRILAGHFPHGSKTVPYRPAQKAVRFDVLHPTLRQLFIRCFEDGHNNPQARPDARSWVKALDEAEKDLGLVSCGVNSEHRYGGHLRDCPWCDRKIQLQGRDPFPARAAIQFNIPVQIPLWPANKPKPVSSPAPTPTYATPIRPTPTPIYNPSPSPTLTATPAHKTTPLATRKFLDKALTLGGISAVLYVSFFLFYPHQDPDLKTKQKHITDYIKSLQLNPNDADTYNKRGLLRYDLEDIQGAIADYKKAIQIDPKFADAYNNMGDANHDLEDQQGAIANYKKAIQVDPKFAEAYKNLGSLHSYLGDNQAAIEAYNQAIEINPKYAEAYLGLGIVRSYLGDKNGAIENYNQAIKDYNQAIQSNPKNAKAYSGRGHAHYLLGDKKAAIEDFTKAIQQHLNSKLAATEYYNRGQSHYDLGDKKAAIEDYNKAIKLNPKSCYPYNGRGLTRYYLGDKQGAIEDLNKAIELNPKYAEAYSNRGLTRMSGDEKAAIEDYNQAIKLNPKLAIPYNNRGRVRYDLGDNKGAIEDYNQAIQLNSKLSDAYYNRGIVRTQLGDKKGAIEDYQQAAQIDQKEGKTEEYQKSIDEIRKLQQ